MSNEDETVDKIVEALENCSEEARKEVISELKISVGL